MIKLFASACLLEYLMGTAGGPCDLATLGDLRGMGIHQPQLKWNIATDDFLEKWEEWVRAKKAFPLTDLYNFEQTTPDNETATSSIGIMVEIRAGKPSFTLIYNKSHCWHKSVFTKKGQGRWNIVLFFEKAVVVFSSVDGTTLSGAQTSMFSVGTFKFQQGTDPQQTAVMFQVPDAEEFNTRMVVLNNSDIAADLNAYKGIIETRVEYTDEVAAGATTTVVKVVSACSGEPQGGLIGAERWRLGGTQATATAITDVEEDVDEPGTYTITWDTSVVNGDTIKPTLGDGTYPSVEDIDGILYAGTAKVAEVVGSPSA